MNLKKRKEEKPMQTKENLSQTVKDVKVEIIKDVFKKENTANTDELLDAR